MTQYLIKDFGISKNILRLRKQARLTQDNLTAKLQTMGVNISRSHFSMIETGKLNIPIDMLVALKIIFRCDYSCFFEGLEEKLKQANE